MLAEPIIVEPLRTSLRPASKSSTKQSSTKQSSAKQLAFLRVRESSGEHRLKQVWYRSRGQGGRREEPAMRVMMLAGCAFVAALASVPPTAEAASYHPWCFRGMAGGAVTCSFDSKAQCMGTQSVSGGFCSENPIPPPAGTPEMVEVGSDAVKTPSYHRWCFRGMSGGAVTCSFDSKAQCMGTQSVSGGFCSENPTPPPIGTPEVVEADPNAALTASYHPWCFRGSSSGSLTCTFDSKAECIGTQGFTGGFCSENPTPPPAAAGAVGQAASPATDDKRKPPRRQSTNQ